MIRPAFSALTICILAHTATAEPISIGEEEFSKRSRIALPHEGPQVTPEARSSTTAKYPIRVSQVYNGDTFAVAGATTAFHLQGIDAQEPANASGPLCFGREAKEYTQKALLNQQIRIEKHGVDEFGRILATVYYDSGKGEVCYNEEMIRDGYARAYPIKHEKLWDYLKLQAAARSKKRGLWKDCYRYYTLGAMRNYELDAQGNKIYQNPSGVPNKDVLIRSSPVGKGTWDNVNGRIVYSDGTIAKTPDGEVLKVKEGSFITDAEGNSGLNLQQIRLFLQANPDVCVGDFVFTNPSPSIARSFCVGNVVGIYVTDTNSSY